MLLTQCLVGKSSLIRSGVKFRGPHLFSISSSWVEFRSSVNALTFSEHLCTHTQVPTHVHTHINMHTCKCASICVRATHTHNHKACCCKHNHNLRRNVGAGEAVYPLSFTRYLIFQEMLNSSQEYICLLAVPQASTRSKYFSCGFLVFF